MRFLCSVGVLRRSERGRFLRKNHESKGAFRAFVFDQKASLKDNFVFSASRAPFFGRLAAPTPSGKFFASGSQYLFGQDRLMTKNHAPLAVDPYYEGVPKYMTDVYDWAYVDPKWVRVLDNNWVVRILLFFNDQRLMRSYLNEIKPGSRVWQLAHVYGDLVTRAAKKIGAKGTFHLTDVTPIQVEHGLKKLAGLDWAKVIRSDAADFAIGERSHYDLICSFFLLHEVPEEKKYEIVAHMLEKLPKGSKAVFVDYHNPSKWQPIRYILKVVNHYLEPFAKALWENEISHYAKNMAHHFTWRKKTFFGGVYQCTVVEHKTGREALPDTVAQ